MMRLKNMLGILFLLMPMLLVATTNAADAPPNLQPLEDIPPPPSGADLNSPDEPEITIVKKGGETVEEYRINGELYMMKVTPAHGTPYYLTKDDPNGSWSNVGPVAPVIIPKWVIFRF